MFWWSWFLNHAIKIVWEMYTITLCCNPAIAIFSSICRNTPIFNAIIATSALFQRFGVPSQDLQDSVAFRLRDSLAGVENPWRFCFCCVVFDCCCWLVTTRFDVVLPKDMSFAQALSSWFLDAQSPHRQVASRFEKNMEDWRNKMISQSRSLSFSSSFVADEGNKHVVHFRLWSC